MDLFSKLTAMKYKKSKKEQVYWLKYCS